MHSGNSAMTAKKRGPGGRKTSAGISPRMSFATSSKSSKAHTKSLEGPETAPAVVDMTKERAQNSEIALLSVYLRSLLGKRCVKARLSYGDELKLHFDTPQWVENAEAAKRG